MAQKLEAIGSLAGGVAHEFNNLLQAIRGYTWLAIKELDEDSQPRNDLGQVVKAADRAADLTRQLLGFGRRQTLMPVDLCPSNIVEDLLNMLRPLIGEQIEIETKLAENVAPVHADETLLQQMLMNLCLNARDAMPDGGSLVIVTDEIELTELYCETHADARPGRYAVFHISDTGCGMPAEVREKIFEPFFTTKEVGKGTGLGLAMVFGVVQQHEGMIHVYSEPGLGTRFTIYLPVATPSVSQQVSEVPEQTTSGSETILIAEDDPLVAQVAARMLRNAGYQTLLAKDGDEAIQVFQANSGVIDLALLDVVMPKRNGWMVYTALKQLKPELCVVFTTGYDPDTNCADFTDREDAPVVPKPFDPQTLLSTIRTTLDRGSPCLSTLTTT